MIHPTLDAWHRMIDERDATALDEVLAEHAVFHSPVVHTPQQGKALTKLYLSAAIMVLGNAGFRYVREVVGESDAVLEFTCEIDGIQINGVDMIHFDAEGRIDDFKVMVRPLKAVNLLHRLMAQMLGSMS
jgi:hypothetical protein